MLQNILVSVAISLTPPIFLDTGKVIQKTCLRRQVKVHWGLD
jgi:hypothetical protein